MSVYLTSDTHFGHNNVLTYSKRPFASIAEHDEALVTNWNAVVKPGDLVYHLGDLALCNPIYAASLVARLAGQKFWLLGNHDGKQMQKRCREFFVKIMHYEEISYESRKVVLCHYPILSWRAMHHGSVMLHGHCHGNLKPSSAKRIDIGVDCWKYAPVSLADAVAAALSKPGEVVDHHKEGILP